MKLCVPSSVDVGEAFALRFEGSQHHPIPVNSATDSVVLVRLRDGAVDSRWQVSDVQGGVCVVALTLSLSLPT